MSTESNFSFSFPDLNEAPTNVSLACGDVVFVVGANGTGKSGLMTALSSQNRGKIKRILAHRQTWLSTNTLEFTPASKVQVENSITSRDLQNDSRWKDDHQQQRSQITIFNLINQENLQARRALVALRENLEEAKKLANEETPIEQLNHLLRLANLPIKISVEADEKVLASKNGGPPYSIAQLSDGERNAVLIIADVLTARPGTLFVIDEPERHLHRSIISPMLSSLFGKRSDCAFVVATHDVGLPLDNPKASTLLVRSCLWRNDKIIGWETNIVPASEDIDYNIKQDILGSRKKILFVEGDETSLDKAIYSLVYPDVSVIPQGDCKEVEKAVVGITGAVSLAWVRPFGLIDSDDRTPEQVEALKAKGIFALPCYSVESLYYSKTMVEKIARRQSETLGQDPASLIDAANQAVITAIVLHEDRMCARVCERRVGAEIKPPSWRAIQAGGLFSMSIDLTVALEAEKVYFAALIASRDVETLVGRYPVRETSVLSEVAKALKFRDRADYEGAVLKLLSDDEAVCAEVRRWLAHLTDALQLA